MKLKRGKEQKDYRLYGCHFTKEEYNFIQNKIKKISNSRILIKLFKLALKNENEQKGQNYERNGIQKGI